MGGRSAVDDAVVRGIEWSSATWLALLALSVVVAAGISLGLCRARTRRRATSETSGTPAIVTVGGHGAGTTPAVLPPSDAWRSGERPVTERLAEVRRLQGAGLITVEQADLRVREILAEV